jgi:hypothetical protein
MNLNHKPALNMSKLSVANKINRALLIVNAIADNASVFVDPEPGLAQLNSAIADLKTAWQDAAAGGKSKTAIMHAKEAELMNLFNTLAAYVGFIANGDAEIVHLAGFDIKGHAFRTKNVFAVKQGPDTGSVIVTADSIRDIAGYFYQYTTEPDKPDSWQGTATNKSKHLFKGLKAGQLYYFRTARVDRKGQHPFTEPISLVVV